MSNEEIIDDNHRRFAYQPNKEWEIITDVKQWEGTIHSTWTFDATASLNFTGVQIKVYITVPAGVGTSAVDFSIDGHTSERRSRTSNSTTLYNFEFYDSGPLDDGDHTIVMTNKGEDNDMDFQLDRVVITPGSSTPSSSSGTLPTPTPPSTLSPSTQVPTETVITAKKTSDTPAIVGSVVAGIVVLAIIGALLFLYTRRQRRAKRLPGLEEKPPFHPPGSPAVSPFTTPPTAASFISPSSTTFAAKGLLSPTTPGIAELSLPSPASSGVTRSTQTNGGTALLLKDPSALRLISVTDAEDNHERPPSYVPSPGLVVSAQ
ncbi:hypothetical protein BJ165DRAFT_1402215 [Panaeolus papilionaceus]|nr:hypothetical protein BJ165DRAFT_1402215 [Panaeolus papilionaceus]